MVVLPRPLRCSQNHVFYHGICFCFFFFRPLSSLFVFRGSGCLLLYPFCVRRVDICKIASSFSIVFYRVSGFGCCISSRRFAFFLFSNFHPSQLLFIFFFVEAVCDFLVCVFNPPRLFFVFFFSSFFDPSRLFFVFSFSYASKVFPPLRGQKNALEHNQTYGFYYCFFRPVSIPNSGQALESLCVCFLLYFTGFSYNFFAKALKSVSFCMFFLSFAGDLLFLLIVLHTFTHTCIHTYKHTYAHSTYIHPFHASASVIHYHRAAAYTDQG